MSLFLFAQEENQTDTSSVTKTENVKDKKFIQDVWKNMKKLDKKYSEYKTVKPEAVAGVRGKAKDETLSDMMYYKGDEVVPQKKQVMAAITKLTELAENKQIPEEDKPEILFFLGRCYLQVEDMTKAKEIFQTINDKYPESSYKQESQTYIESLK